jgi:hypothetical protein
MYQEITEEELSKRMNLVDKALNFGTKDAKELLNLVHTLFPLEYVMPEDFKGTHHIVIEDGKLRIGVWVNNSVYDVVED